VNKIKPMLAATVDDLSQVKFPCYVQPKLDGIRCLVIDGVAYSRKMKPIPNKYIQKMLKNVTTLYPLDGELMLPEGDFNSVQSAVMSEDGEPNFIYFVFDMIMQDKPFSERSFFTTNEGFFRTLPQSLIANVDSLKEYYLTCMTAGYEGIMIRSPEGLYKHGRSTLKEGYLLKYKEFKDSEAKIIGFNPKMHNGNVAEKDELGHTKRSHKKAGLIALDTLGALEVYDVGILKNFSVGSGFDDAMRKEIWDNQDKYFGGIITYTFQELSSKGVPRFPVFKGFRKD